MSKSKILYDNRLLDATPAASSTAAAAGLDVRNLADARPYTWWSPSTLPATVTVDCLTAKAADAACIVAHNLASMGCDVQIRGSTDGFSASDVLVASVIPSADGPIWQSFASVSYRYWRLRIDGPGAPALDLDFAGTRTLPSGVTFTRADASTCATYFDGSGVLKLAAANVARFDHDPVTGQSLGLLIEESRTNLYLNSDVLTASTGTTVESNATAGPDGAVTAEKLVEDSSTGEHFANDRNITLAAGTSYVYSYFVKAGSGRNFHLRVSGINVADLIFDPSAGRIVQTGGAQYSSSGVMLLPNGWYRIWMVLTAGTSGNTVFRVQITLGTTSVYTGDSSGSVYATGGDVQAGAFLSSHIPTAGAAVTRAADSVSMTSTAFSSWYSQIAGTFMAAFNMPAGSVPSFPMLAAVSDGTASNYASIYKASSGSSAVSYDTMAASVHQGFITVGNVVARADSRVAVAFKSNDCAGSMDGAAVVADTTVTLPVTMNKIDIGSRFGVSHLNGAIARLVYWPKRLTNTQLQWLTSADRGTVGLPSLAIAMIGAAMELPVGLEAPFDPTGRKLDGRRIQNNDGQPLGHVVDYARWEQTINLRAVPWSWVRSAWQPAWEAALGSAPFVFAWDPVTYPDEVRLVTTNGDYSTPHRSGSLCDLSVTLRGVA